MKIVAFDSETELIRPGCLAPRMVCLTFQRPGLDAHIVHANDAKPYIEEWLRDAETLLVGANTSYDLAVIAARWPDLIPDIFSAYHANRVTDVQIRQKLLDIASGVYRGRPDAKGKWVRYEYSLEALAKRVGDMQLKKDTWRLLYGEFLNLPLEKWVNKAKELQEKARMGVALSGEASLGLAKQSKGEDTLGIQDPERIFTYALDDARATLAVYLKQEEHDTYLDDQFRQARAAWWLHLSSAWGIKTDPVGVEVLRKETEAQVQELTIELVAAGLVRPDGTRDTKAAAARMVEVCKAERLPLRRTASHTEACAKDADCHICLDADACLTTGDPVLEAYAELSTAKKVLTNDVEALKKGTTHPLHPRYDLAETGRTTCRGPNLQNLRRKAGIREAFVPRPGKVFAQADYPQLELYTLAQCCKRWVGFSQLADALNAGSDPHLQMASEILNISYEEAAAHKKRPDVQNARQTAKVANFGFPGGLGIDKLVLFAKKSYGVDLTHDRAADLKQQWFNVWPEMRHYFDYVSSLDGRVVTLFTNRVRGNATYCASCNNGFQALGADCAKEAGWRIAVEQYLNQESPLYGSRTVAFVHDEFIVECDIEVGHYVAEELARVMCEGANIYLPDVPIPVEKLEPLLMTRWSKDAQPTYRDGRLVPWSPEVK